MVTRLPSVLSSAMVGTLALGLWTLPCADAAPLAAQEVERASWGACTEEGRTGPVLEGSVVDRATGAALGGARVQVMADAARKAILGGVSTDASGSFTICGPEEETPVRLVASYRSHESEPKPVVPPDAGVRLSVDLGTPAFLLFSVVDDRTDRPVEGARIDLWPVRLAGVTDSAGRLAFTRVPPIRYAMTVEHLAYQPLDDTLQVLAGQRSEVRVPLSTRVHALEPLTVTVTGRDPYLVQTGFYDRRNRLEDGYFALGEEVRPYRLLSTLFTFKRELIIRFRGNRVVLVDGRPMWARGYQRLDEIPLHRIRGVEAFRCGQAPQEYLRYVASMDCSMILLWTR